MNTENGASGRPREAARCIELVARWSANLFREARRHRAEPGERERGGWFADTVRWALANRRRRRQTASWLICRRHRRARPEI